MTIITIRPLLLQKQQLNFNGLMATRLLIFDQ
jgi:hypothetical protein